MPKTRCSREVYGGRGDVTAPVLALGCFVAGSAPCLPRAALGYCQALLHGPWGPGVMLEPWCKWGSRSCLPAPACSPCRSAALFPPWGRWSVCRGRAGGGVSRLPPSCHHIYAIGTLAGCDWPLFGMHLHPRDSSTPAKALLKPCASRAVKSWSFRQPKH